MGVVLDILVTVEAQGVDRDLQRAVLLHGVEVVAGDASLFAQWLVDDRRICCQRHPGRQRIRVAATACLCQFPTGLHASLMWVMTRVTRRQVLVAKMFGHPESHGGHLLFMAGATEGPFLAAQQRRLLPAMARMAQQALAGSELGMRLFQWLLFLVASGTSLWLVLPQQVHVFPAVEVVAGQAVLLLDRLMAHCRCCHEDILVALPASRRPDSVLGLSGMRVMAGGTFPGLLFRVGHEHRPLDDVIGVATGAKIALWLAKNGLGRAAVSGMA